MSDDWRSRVNIKRSDGYRVAAAILGLLFLLIFAGWLISRFMRQAPPPPLQTPTPTPSPTLPP